MGLFDKKYCDFCSEKIGLLGNKKLEDGNMCKSCAAKLSPWFSERWHSTSLMPTAAASSVPARYSHE